MTAPRIEIDLNKIRQNTRILVDWLALRGIRVAGVTKAVCGDPDVAKAMLAGGVSGIAEARINNTDRLRAAGIKSRITMIRAPLLSEVSHVVRNCDTSYNTGIDVIAELSTAALRAGRVHNVILMVEMGDGRDGILPCDLGRIASLVTGLPGVTLKGIAANFACLGNVAPNALAMAILSKLADEIEDRCGSFLDTVSGGGSANLPWALGCGTKGRTNELRLGEAILLGTEPVSGLPVRGLHTDAFTLVGEVNEVQSTAIVIPVQLVTSTPVVVRLVPSNLRTSRVIIALGQQDTDVSGLSFPPEFTLIGATSDHAVLETTQSAIAVGDEIRCQMNYGALMRAMNAGDVGRMYINQSPPPPKVKERQVCMHMTLV